MIYGFYWNGYPDNVLSVNTVDIPAKSTVDVEVVKSGLTVGDHKVWIDFEYADDGKEIFYREITVTGLADLETDTIATSPSFIQSGDSVLVSTLVENTGSEDADASRMQIELGDQSEVVDVPHIPLLLVDGSTIHWLHLLQEHMISL